MDNEKLQLLLVDDDEEDYSITRDKLAQIEELHCDATWVTTYDQAVQALTGRTWSLCITDYNLRGAKTGIDLVAQMTGQGTKVPFIVLTGQGTLNLCMEAGRSGAFDFLDKGSVTPQQLGAAIGRALLVARTAATLRETEEQLRRVSEK
jgi:two-component system, cell cycle sensor histidine kinase and response regulator CckA